MFYWNQSLATALENVALDEAIVEFGDRSDESGNAIYPDLELLRLWEFPFPTVVMGRESRFQQEVNVERCLRDNVPILRRASGGSTIVAGPGCLMYTVLISYTQRPLWRSLDVAHREVMNRIEQSVRLAFDSLSDRGISLSQPDNIRLQGTCDLTRGNQKFSGNALRCKRNCMLYHGTLLIDMPLHWITSYLSEPPRQPDYRNRRTHDQFVCNLLPTGSPDVSVFRAMLEKSLQQVWKANSDWDQFPDRHQLESEQSRLMQMRYLNRDWHFER